VSFVESPRLQRVFLFLLAGLILAYLAIELIYVVRFPLVMDEFQFGYMVNQLRHAVPYRDYVPYKTVLGYYLELPALLINDGDWNGLIAIKIELALITAAGVALAGFVMRRRFGAMPTLLALASMLFMTNFLERSAELRVDMLAGLLGMFALLLLVTRRDFASGALVGFAFCVSQKSVYYAAASVVALIVAPLVYGQKSDLRRLLRFIAGGAAIVVPYLVLWSLVSSPAAVFASVVGKAGDLALGDYYEIRGHFWLQTLVRNPAFWLAAIGAIVFLSRRSESETNAIVVTYAIPFAALAFWHKQPWPYYFVIIVPVLAVVMAAACAELLPLLRANARMALIAAVIAFGVFLPLLRLGVTLKRDNTYQRRTVEAAARIVQPPATCFAGVDLLYKSEPAVKSLQWLDAIRNGQLANMTPKEQLSLIAQLDRAQVKLVVMNYRIAALPRLFRLYIVSTFEPLAGNLFTYAPAIAPGTFKVAFSGRYRVESRGPIAIDGTQYAPAAVTTLAAGPHVFSGGRLRLRLLVDVPIDPMLQQPRELFDRVYDF